MTFDDFLKEKHAKNYAGTDDNMPDKFEAWLSQLDVQEVIDYAEEWGDTLRKVFANDAEEDLEIEAIKKAKDKKY